MGARNTGVVLANWTHLPDPALRCLMLMAHVIHDDDENPTWFGGREALAHALGRVNLPPDEKHKRDCKCVNCLARKAAFQAVKVAMNQLIQAGAASLVVTPRAGRRAEYRMHLGVGHAYSSGVGDAYPQGYDSPTAEGYATPTPKELRKEPQRNTRGGKKSPEVPISLGAVENPPPKIDPSLPLCPHGNPATRIGGPGTEPTCPECRRATR